jgi:peptidoglycan/LPS O-acetylase OafA/YrhL
MGLSLKRITSSGAFIPEIDGLRFIAIASVLLHHLNKFIQVKDKHQYLDHFNFEYINKILEKGSIGVPLFFVISGFILGLPFAKHYLLGDKPVQLKQYFTRRLTRLEPPYILVMSVLFIITVYFVKTLSLSEGLRSYFASLFYIHNFCYPKDVLPLLNGVAWSLEIEVQFYILAPLLAAMIFRINKGFKRRIYILLSILFLIAFNHVVTLPFKSLINYIQYFLTGFLLVDLYINKVWLLPKTKLDGFIAFAFFCCALFFYKVSGTVNNENFIGEVLHIISIFWFYYYILFLKAFKILSNRIITNIGGMCYSIYLVHYPLISLMGNKILRFQFSTFSVINIGIYSICILIFVFIISAVFFLTVERPCMRRDWYKYIFRKRPVNLNSI